METNEELKIRVLKAKENLPNQITSLFFHYYKNVFPKDKKNTVKLNNVLQLRAADLFLTEKIEELENLVTPLPKLKKN